MVCMICMARLLRTHTCCQVRIYLIKPLLRETIVNTGRAYGTHAQTYIFTYFYY